MKPLLSTFSIFAVLLLASCSSVKPLVTEETDKTGWFLVGTVMNYNVPEVNWRLISQGIPAWCDPKGYPCYPVTTPPEYAARARELNDDLLLGNHQRFKNNSEHTKASMMSRTR